jgi:hypothetical protein
MHELIFTFLVVTQAGLPGFHREHISRFQAVEDCEKSRTAMVVYMDKLVKENRMFPGVFECRKVLTR